MLDIFRKRQTKDGIVLGRKDGDRLVLDSVAELEHTAIFGAGSDHQRSLLQDFLLAALRQGGGAVYVDGSGDPDVRARVTAMCEAEGRIDDLMVVDFRRGGGADLPEGFTNTFNPFEEGNSDEMTQMVVSLMGDAGGDGAMWRGRATAMLTGVMRALTWLRDQGAVHLNVGSVRDYLNIRAIIDLADPKIYPDMPPAIRKSVRSYLTSLPGFQEDKGHKQAQTTHDQHGYLEMQFTKILGTLADVYGHIFFTDSGDVSLRRAMDDKRLVLFCLPSLEAAGDEIGNLGKIVVAGIRQALAQDSLDEDRSRKRSGVPFRVVLADAAYYMVDGMGPMLQAARASNMSITISADSPWHLTRMMERESISLAENIGNRIYLRLSSMQAQRHILELPVNGTTRRRMLDMNRNEGYFIGQGRSRWFGLEEPVSVISGKPRSLPRTFKVPTNVQG